MSMRTINPPRRFTSFPVIIGSPVGTAFVFGQTISRFRFEQDSILHTVNMQSQFATPITAASAFLIMAVGFSDMDGLSMEDQNDYILMAVSGNGDAAGPTTVKQITTFTNQVETHNMLVRAGSVLHVGIQANSTASGWDISGNVTISFSTLSEWVNFREPTVAVRL